MVFIKDITVIVAFLKAFQPNFNFYSSMSMLKVSERWII